MDCSTGCQRRQRRIFVPILQKVVPGWRFYLRRKYYRLAVVAIKKRYAGHAEAVTFARDGRLVVLTPIYVH